ncbi:MAG: NAD(P)/FAD-dependent oxidoreductase [Candidatus Sungbacteria bacterium]|nr:NAD(P)/FAD-dependent oxidoreductase [Candidatus Sungbacteria bacterium]
MREIKKTILIAGAGFGGMTAALKLERRLRNNPAWRIVLIDKNPYQLYTPALYEIAAIPNEDARQSRLRSIVAIPIAEILKGKKITFIQGVLTNIDRLHQCVHIGAHELAYAFLILALGSETNYFDIPGLREHALPLKRFEDAVRVRNGIERMLAGHRLCTVVAGGAGASGVELVAELANFICHVTGKTVSETTCPVRLVLIEMSDHILPGFEPWLVRRARARLERIGIEIRAKNCITSVSKTEIMLKDAPPIRYDMLIWTGGVVGNPLYENLGLPLTDKKSCTVNEFLQVDDRILAIGDAAGFVDARSNKPLPWNVPIAESEARMVARNILREISGKPKSPFCPSSRYPYVLAVGRKYAIADLVFIRFWGFAGWCAKLLVELRYLLFILPFPRAIRIWLKGIRVYTSND